MKRLQPICAVFALLLTLAVLAACSSSNDDDDKADDSWHFVLDAENIYNVTSMGSGSKTLSGIYLSDAQSVDGASVRFFLALELETLSWQLGTVDTDEKAATPLCKGSFTGVGAFISLHRTYIADASAESGWIAAPRYVWKTATYGGTMLSLPMTASDTSELAALMAGE